ncbi:glycoside hydrolase family 38 C-terminal domain-containing protein [Streptomyces sp. NPDC049881]|uniref:alpha-mannosidase n=1 Tax=Streptomyces sp. NPDC049881 TaxID=3155778 RepID=UPI0034289EDC
MHDHRRLAEERISTFIRTRLTPALHGPPVLFELSAWRVPGEPVPLAEAQAASYEPFTLGDTWGGPWATTWLRARATVPGDWAGRRVEAVFDLDFDYTKGPGGQAEGLVHLADGTPLQGLHPYHRTVLLTPSAAGGDPVDLLIELAANPPIIGSAGIGTHYGDPATAGDTPLYRLRTAEIAVRHEDVWHLLHDMTVLDELMHQLPQESPRRHEIRRALENAVDAVDGHDIPGTAHRGRAAVAGVLAGPAHASAHRISAVGHAHIDSAWLWPLRETVRKCARTFTNMTTLAQEYPELVFACSSAQQYAWIKETRPEIFARIRQAVADGTWVPVGGMWVEADGNLPGGESLVRQLVYGRRFFERELGVEPGGVWLPDSFGYTAAYPQLAAQAGARWFLTQKLSWNETNRLPHHTFWWEGIDGTRIFTHFPPVDSYNAELTGAELAHAERNFADKGAATRSLVPFGHGDGGGGPTPEMLERARRLRDLEGSPRVSVDSPDTFFAQAREEYPDAPVWRGELYLETHRGTYTSQARTKRGNRRSESLLREAELWSATAAVLRGAAYPYERLEELWKRVLLLQFHDILPGTSIAWVHREAERAYEEIHAELEELIGTALDAFTTDGDGDEVSVFNAGPYRRCGVSAITQDGTAPAELEPLSDGRAVVVADVPAGGSAPLGAWGEDVAGPVRAEALDEGGFVLDNGLVRVQLDSQGLVRSLLDHAAGREAVAPGGAGNLLQLHGDRPVRWSAWNLDHTYRNAVTDLTDAVSVTLADTGPAVAGVRVERVFCGSRVVQYLELPAGSRRLSVHTDIDWQERDAVLKAAWPLDIHADFESAEVQFGHVRRPTHVNTSWDAARFEVWNHRWVHVGEHGWGVALLNDGLYGHDVARSTREGGGTTTTVRLSLLRAPHSPDPGADGGRHRFSYALEAGVDVGGAVAGGYEVNLPLRVRRGGGVGEGLLSVEGDQVVVEGVKLADDGSGDVVVRLYESRGGAASVVLRPSFPVAGAVVCDLLENPLAGADPLRVSESGGIALRVGAFGVCSLRLAVG